MRYLSGVLFAVALSFTAPVRTATYSPVAPASSLAPLTQLAMTAAAAGAPTTDGGTDATAGDAVAADDGTTIDVLMLYTPAARVALGGVPQIQAAAANIIAQTNTVFGNSLINPRMRLVGVIELAYTEAVDIDLDLQSLRTGPARGLRDTAHADLVQLLVNSADPTGCGRSYQLTDPEAEDFEAYSVAKVSPECLSNYLPTRLLAYNLGAGGAPEDGPVSGAFNYSAGYKDTVGGFRTVMADECAPVACPVIPNFSNPLVIHNLRPTGGPLADNARTINNTAETVANWRQAAPPPVIPPGSVTTGTQISGSDVRFSWTATEGATNYILQIGTAPGASNVLNAPVGNLTDTVLSFPLGSYYWRVIASSEAGPGQPSAESQFSITSTCGIPTAPTTLESSVFGGQVFLTWYAPILGTVTTYAVEVGSVPGMSDRYLVRTPNSQPQISGRVPGGTYYVRVRAENSCGAGPASNEVSFSIGVVPLAPRDLRLSLQGGLVHIAWNVESGTQPVSDFILEAGSAPGLTDLAQFATPQNALTVGKPGPGVYYVRVRARGPSGVSAPSTEVVFVVQ